MNIMQSASSEPAGAYREWRDDVAHPPADFSETSFSIDFAAIRGIMWRQRFTLVSITVAAILIGFVITLLTTPIYQATATVKLDPKPIEIIDGQDTTALTSRDIIPYKETLAAVIKSRSAAKTVIGNRALLSNLSPADSEKPADMSDKVWQQQKQVIAIGKLQAGLSIDTQTDLNIMDVSFSSSDPEIAMLAANAYVDYLLTDDIKRSFEQSEYSRKYLLDQINQLQTKLALSERQSIAYARAAKIIAPGMLSGGSTDQGDSASSSTAAPQTVTGSNLIAINQAYAEARNQRIAMEERWKSAAKAPAGSLPEVQQNATIQSFMQKRGEATAGLADLRTRYGEDYPRARELKAQIAALDRQIQQLSDDVKRGLQAAYQTALSQENSLAGEVSRISDQTLDEQSRRVQFGQLERETAAYRKQLDGMLTRYNELSASANIKPSTITRLDNAERPGKPTSPNIVKNLLLATVLGLGLAAGVAFLLEILDDRLRTIADLERKLKLPTLGVTPLIEGEHNLMNSSALDEAYSSARISLEFALSRNSDDHTVVAFTSSQASEGKSTSAFMIAKKMAAHGRKVLLVDTDLRKPTLARMVDRLRTDAGLIEVLLGSATLESVLVPVEGTDLVVLPAGNAPGLVPIEILSSPLFSQFIKRCSQQYPLVVLDSPPVMGLADAPTIARLADCTVFIIEANRAHFGQAKAALRRLRDSGANVIGAVLTKFVALNAGQSYDYQYAYYTYGNEEK